MAELGGSIDEVFRAPGAPAAVAAHFADRARIVACTDEVDRHELVGDDTIHFLLVEQSHAGYRFRPDYRVRYRLVGLELTWEAVEPSNLKNSGRARFEADGDGTRVRFQQRIAFELPIPRMVIGMVQPIVDRILAPSLRRYVDKMIAQLG
ncbi:MAG TPA: hypothetical protein PKA64_06970 [Myxococcota bacterium]|nr:hypothetical protein [Myxococcota bacterium]